MSLETGVYIVAVIMGAIAVYIVFFKAGK